MNRTIAPHNALVAIAAVLMAATIVVSPSLLGQTQVKKVPITPETAALTDGGELYQALCAACHGETAKGDGPAVPALKMMPTDLTVLARENRGEFPSGLVTATLEGKGVTAHGSAEMPTWGPILRGVSVSETPATIRIRNLTEYIKSIQVK